MNRVTPILILAGLLLTPAASLAQAVRSTPSGGSGVSGAPSAPRARPVDPRTAAMVKLNRTVTVELSEARLEDALQFIQDFTGAELDILWSDSRSTGLDKDRPVTVSVREVPALRLLERVLEKVQDDFDENTWQMTPSGIVEVGPKSRLNRSKFLKIYDIQDLLFVIPDFTQVPEMDLETVLNQGQSGGGGGGGGIFRDQDQDDRRPEPSDEELAQKIIDLIVENIEPEQWQDNGGEGGSIRFFNGTLLIRAPEYMHRQINGPEYRMPSRRSRTGAAAKAPASETATAQAGAPGESPAPAAPAASPPAPAQASTPAGAPPAPAPGDKG